jgi:enamine deaminase RidA (YjgF/YER057c/UK114 family)
MRRELINPEGVFAHPAYAGVLTVTDPRKFHFIAGRTPADPDDYSCVAPGDFRAQYRHVMKSLDIELKAVGATSGSERRVTPISVPGRTLPGSQ